jgi:hypothetical protein
MDPEERCSTMTYHTNMFATLDSVTRLVDEGKVAEAYILMRDAVKGDSHGFSRLFLLEWVKHLREEDGKVQDKFAPVIARLQEDFPEIQLPPNPGTTTVPASDSQTRISEEILPLKELTLSFYDWQMNSISKAAIREKVNEATLLAQMLETGNLDPLTWARYRRGKASPSSRIRVKVTAATKEGIDSKREKEEVTLTKYVRKFLFGERAERY